MLLDHEFRQDSKIQRQPITAQRPLPCVIRSSESLIRDNTAIDNALFYREGDKNGISWEIFCNGENQNGKSYMLNQIELHSTHKHHWYNVTSHSILFDHAFAVTAPFPLANVESTLSSFTGTVVDGWARSSCSLLEYLNQRHNPYSRRLAPQTIMIMAVGNCGVNKITADVLKALQDKTAELKAAVLPKIIQKSRDPQEVESYLLSGSFYNLRSLF